MANEITIEEFEELKTKIEKAKIRRSKAEGNLEQLQERLVSEFDVNTIEEAEEVLKNMQENIEKSKTRLNSILKEIDGLVDRSLL